MGKQECLSRIGNQYYITISLMAVKTRTNKGNNQKFSRKLREESVEAI